MRIHLACFILLLNSPSWATTYYVSKTASNGYAVGSDSNTCTQAQNQATPKNTIWGTSGAKSCLAGGDVVYVNEGTYGDEILNPPAGSAAAYTTILADPASATRPTLLIPDRTLTKRAFYCTNGSACSYIRLEGFEITGDYEAIKLSGNSTLGYPHHIQIVNNIIHDTWKGMFFCSTSDAGYLGGDHLIQRNEIYRTNLFGENYSPGANTIYNPGNRTIIEHNTFHNLSNAIAIWHSGKYLQNVIIRYNRFYNIGLKTVDPFVRGQGGYAAVGVSVPGGGHKIHHNTIWNVEGNTGSAMININPQFDDAGLGQVEVYNNTFYNFTHSTSYAVRQQATGGGPYLIKNNIAISAGQGFVGGTQANNRTTGIATDVWNGPSVGDLTLKAGSAAINAGTDVGLPFCGTTIDQGAFEVCGFSSASITGATLDVTMESAYPPLQVLGSTGLTVSCTPNPDPCGSPTVVSASLVGGSSAIARLFLTGIANSNCTANQLWTVSYTSASSGLSDYIIMGGSLNQFAHGFTGRAVTNNCTGGGSPALPGTPYILYEFDGNANDTSGGARHGAANSVTFVAAKYGQGAKTDLGQDDYVEAPYPSAVNPTAQSLTFAGTTYIDSADACAHRAVAGTPSGTNQHFHVYISGCTWRLLVQGIGGVATEFTVRPGWNQWTVTFDSATDIARLHINRVAGAIAGASVISYSSFTFAGNLRIGRFSGSNLSAGPNHIYDRFVLYQSVESYTAIYDSWEPSTSAWGGNLSVVASRVDGAKLADGVRLAKAAANTSVTVPAGGAFALVFKTCATVSNPAPIGQRLMYTCPLCPSGGAVLPVSDTSGVDKIRFYAVSNEPGLLSGAYDTHIDGGSQPLLFGATNLTSSSIPVFDLGVGDCTQQTYVLQDDGGTENWVRSFFVREQSGLALDGYAPVGGIPVTVGRQTANGGF